MSRLIKASLIAAAMLSESAVAKEGAGKPQVPLWELGLGIGAVGFPDYRGATRYNVYPVPVPYVVYRGDHLKADRNGLRGLFLNRDWLEVNLSGGATTPVRSSHRGAREGMPALRPTIEAGPSIDFHLWKSADGFFKLDFRTPVRFAVTLESSPRSLGWFVAPNLNLDIHGWPALQGWDFGLLAGPLFAQRRYDEYFYTVAPAYARAGRPEYEARGGYAGSQVIAALTKRFRKYWIGSFLRYDILSGASFDGSPLVRTHHGWSGGIGIAWMIGQSSRLVDDE